MAGPATRAVTLSVQMSDYASSAPGIVDGFRIVISITGVSDFADTKLFRYELIPQTTPGGSEMNSFNGVCSPVDLEEFAADAPIPGMVPPYFRLAVVDLVFRSRTQGMTVYQAILDDIGRLIRSKNIMDTLGAGVTVTVGPLA